jgi:hypothetical protein
MSEDLPLIRPNAARGAQTMQRCHARLEAHRRKLEESARTPASKTVTTERLVLVGACAAYLLSMAGNILRTLDLQ